MSIRWRTLWAVAAFLPLVLVACSGGGLLPIGQGVKGETLIIVIEDIKRVQEVRYQGTDENHYLVFPSSRDNELVVVRLNVHNQEATVVQMTVDEEALEIRGFGTNETYRVLNLNPSNPDNVKQVESTHPNEDRYVPFIAGAIELPQAHSVIGWTVFEVPKGAELREMRWDAGGDTIFISS